MGVVLTTNAKSSQKRKSLEPSKAIPSPITDGPAHSILFNSKVNACVERFNVFGSGDRISYWIKRTAMRDDDLEAIRRAAWLSDPVILSCLSAKQRNLRYTVQIADKLGLLSHYLDDKAGLVSTAVCLKTLKDSPKLAKIFVDWAADISIHNGKSDILQMVLANVSKYEGKGVIVPLSWYSQLSANLSGRNLTFTEALTYLSTLDKESTNEVLVLFSNVSVVGTGGKQVRDLSARLVSDLVGVLSTSEGVTSKTIKELRETCFWIYPESITLLKCNSSIEEKLARIKLYVYLRNYDIKIDQPTMDKDWLTRAESLREKADIKRSAEIEKRKEEERLLMSQDSNGQLILQF